MCPGIASRLPPSGGAQNEWITSAEVIESCTTLPSGTCNSFAVTSASSRYRNSHHHWWPITSTLRASAGASPPDPTIVATAREAPPRAPTADASGPPRRRGIRYPELAPVPANDLHLPPRRVPQPSTTPGYATH